MILRQTHASLLLGLAMSAALCTPVTAATFQFLGTGSGQHMRWYWERYYPVNTCMTNPLFPCGLVNSTDGRIALAGRNDTSTAQREKCIVTSGKLDWTTSSPSRLTVVALTNAIFNYNAMHGYAGACDDGLEGWIAVDAREEPMVFGVLTQAGDPVQIDLGITPRLVGTVQQTTVPGSSSLAQVQYLMAVAVDGVQVARDSLYRDVAVEGGADTTWNAVFPKGAANDVVLSGIPNGALVTITLWAYMRGQVTNTPPAFAMVNPSGPYGNGPAIAVDLQVLNAVAVPTGGAAATATMVTRPNPSSGALRVLYAIPRASQIQLAVYDVAGRRVATLADRWEEAGPHELAWDAAGPTGRRLPPGVYLVELRAGAERAWGRHVVLGP